MEYSLKFKFIIMVMRARRGSFQKTIKDYIVPIIGGILILILIISVFTGGDNPSDTGNDLENRIGLSVSLGGDTSEAEVEYPGGYEKSIEGSIDVYKGEKIIVSNGMVGIDFPGSAKMQLNRLGELKYNEDGTMFLESSDLWVNAKSNLQISMRYIVTNIDEGSVVSLSQNEVGSTVYVLGGVVTIKSNSGKETVLGSGQKITITNLETTKEDIDLVLLKESLDNSFKSSDWFIKNNGEFYLLSNEEEEDMSSTGTVLDLQSGLISLDNLRDETNSNDSEIDITGKYSKDTISKISVNGKAAQLDSENKTFSLDNYSLDKTENDLVFKVYDAGNDIIGKYVYTIYYSGGSSANNNNSSGFSVETFDTDGALYKFTSPSTSGYFSTFDEFVTIRGTVSDANVVSVQVNGYTLSSYLGSTWRYHASEQNNNLNLGTNQYEVRYLGKDGKLIYRNFFTIVKNTPGEKIISDEIKTTN